MVKKIMAQETSGCHFFFFLEYNACLSASPRIFEQLEFSGVLILENDQSYAPKISYGSIFFVFDYKLIETLTIGMIDL